MISASTSEALESECLRVDLMELTSNPALAQTCAGTSAPCTTPAAFHRAAFRWKPDGAHDAGGRLGPQGDVVLALIDEAEHLAFFDDIGEIADGTLGTTASARSPEHRKFFVAVAREHLARNAFQVCCHAEICAGNTCMRAQGLDDLGQDRSNQPVQVAFARPIKAAAPCSRRNTPSDAGFEPRAMSPAPGELRRPMATARLLISSCIAARITQIHVRIGASPEQGS